MPTILSKMDDHDRYSEDQAFLVLRREQELLSHIEAIMDISAPREMNAPSRPRLRGSTEKSSP